MTKADIQLIRSLSDKRAREEAELFVAEGEKLVRELLASDFTVRRVYYTDGDFATFPAVDAERIAAKEMERASHLKTPTDCLALVEIPRRKFIPASLAGHLTLALDGVQNPGNMGTIMRLADWFGIRTVLCSADCADCFNPKVVQATMGAIARVEVYYGNLKEIIEEATNHPVSRIRDYPPFIGGESPYPFEADFSLPVYGTFLDGENLYGASLSTDGIIVLGSEGRGISAGVERLVTRKLFIPPYPADGAGTESLNVAVAAAIVCSEFRRRCY